MAILLGSLLIRPKLGQCVRGFFGQYCDQHFPLSLAKFLSAKMFTKIWARNQSDLLLVFQTPDWPAGQLVAFSHCHGHGHEHGHDQDNFWISNFRQNESLDAAQLTSNEVPHAHVWIARCSQDQLQTRSNRQVWVTWCGPSEHHLKFDTLVGVAWLSPINFWPKSKAKSESLNADQIELRTHVWTARSSPINFKQNPRHMSGCTCLSRSLYPKQSQTKSDAHIRFTWFASMPGRDISMASRIAVVPDVLLTGVVVVVILSRVKSMSKNAEPQVVCDVSFSYVRAYLRPDSYEFLLHIF